MERRWDGAALDKRKLTAAALGAAVALILLAIAELAITFYFVEGVLND